MADHETSKLDKSSHLLLDQPLLRLPYELLRNNFRAAHFAVERDNRHLRTLLRDTATASVAGKATHADALKSLDDALARLRDTRAKLAECAAAEARLCRQVDVRAGHLAELAAMHTLDDVKYEAWSRRRLDRLVVDYMLRHGYSASAAALADEKGMRDLVEIETFVRMSEIQKQLRNGSVTSALAWCNDNKKELRKLDSTLEFQLRYQQYIELVRTQSLPKLVEAIHHARKHFTPVKHTYPREVHQAAGLLAFPPGHNANQHPILASSRTSGPGGPEADTYDRLWSPDRWTMLADLFTTTHNQLLGLPSSPLLHIALSSGLSALKTPACHSKSQQQGGRGGGGGRGRGGAAGATAATAAATADHTSSVSTSVCPVCSTELNELARGVPYAHHSKSHVENDLVVLPNGRVYGKARLEEYAAKAGLGSHEVKDLRTGDVFPVSKLKKVYIT